MAGAVGGAVLGFRYVEQARVEAEVCFFVLFFVLFCLPSSFFPWQGKRRAWVERLVEEEKNRLKQQSDAS